jgi:hypothetical protein
MSLASLLAAALLAASPAGLDQLRTQRQQADQRQAAIEARLGEQQAQLESVSKHIDSLKSQSQSSASPFAPGGLDELLKQSQSLSQALAELRAQAAQVRAEDAARRAELAQAIDGRLSADRAALGTANASPDLVAEIRSLESEKASLSTSVLAPEASAGAVRFHGRTDDPRELRERADALRDRADKLTKERAKVEARIAELRDQAELDRQLRSISRQDALFDEGDARVQVQRQVSTASTAPTASAGGAADVATKQTSDGSSHTSPLYTGGQLTLPGYGLRAGATQSNDALNPTTGAFTPSNTSTTPNIQGTTPPHDSTTTTAPIDGYTTTMPVIAQGQVVRPEDLVGQGGAVAAPVDENSIEDLRGADARLQQQLEQLRKEAAALDRQAAQAK